MNYSIAIIGNKETILGFKALGLETFNANSSEEATATLFELKKETIEIKGDTKPKYAIIFITEELAMNIKDEDYKKLSLSSLPAIIPVPSSKGATKYGLARIGKMVEQAIGSDIMGA